MAESSANKGNNIKFVADLSGIKSPLKKGNFGSEKNVRLILNENGSLRTIAMDYNYTIKSKKF
jgi:hypothetical protein